MTLLTIGADWPAGVGPGTVLLGLPLLRRQVLAAERAGFDRVGVEPVEGLDLTTLLRGTRAEAGPLPDSDSAWPAVRLSAGVLPRIDWLRSLRAGAGGGAAAVSDADRFEIRGREDLPRAERWLLEGLIKDSEGFLSRHFERRISLAISRRLAGSSVTPNAMTLISVGVGLSGAAFLVSDGPLLQVAGALLFLAHSILDGCDGELARLKFQESRFGGVLDFWGDNVVHSAVFAAIAIGWWRASGEIAPLALGASAIAGTLLSAGFVYWRTMRQAREGPLFTSVTRAGESRLSRLADLLARRDFIYLLLVLSAFGKTRWFLVLAALGAPAFLLVLMGIAAAERSSSPTLERADRSAP